MASKPRKTEKSATQSKRKRQAPETVPEVAAQPEPVETAAAALPEAASAGIAPEPTSLPEHEDGIYFGLDANEYHADPALGSSNIKDLIRGGPYYWWNSWMNPARERVEKDHLAWGSAFHVLICEGEEAFHSRYYRGPAKKDYQNLLVTMDDLKRWLQLRGFAQTGNKAELIKRVLNADPEAPIWDEIVEKHNVLAGKRYVLKPEDFDTILLSSKMITKNPSCAKAFQNGYPEVSVFWTEDGIRLKMRVDYLRFRALVDLKSIRNWRENRSFDSAVRAAISNYRYDIQAAHYLNGRARIPDFIREGRVFGDKPPQAWLDRLASEPNPLFVFIFYQAEGAPISSRWDYHPEAGYHDAAQAEIRRGLEVYRRHLEVFGTSIWVDVSDPHRLADEDFPAWHGMQSA